MTGTTKDKTPTDHGLDTLQSSLDYMRALGDSVAKGLPEEQALEVLEIMADKLEILRHRLLDLYLDKLP